MGRISILWGAWNLGSDLVRGDLTAAGADIVGIGIDLAAAAVPFVPAPGTLTVQTTRLGANTVADASTSTLKAATPGAYKSVNESMPKRAADYQARVTGTPVGQAYVVKGVAFDGFENGVLLEAKSDYGEIAKGGSFIPGFKVNAQFVSQAERRIFAADGAPIEWRFMEAETLEATRKLFEANGIEGISLVLVP